jgi:hypothetical protein
MVNVVFLGFYAALIRAASFISVGHRQSWGSEEQGSEDVCLHVTLCEPGNWAGREWHMDGLLPQDAYAPRAMTQPPAFTGYAQVRQTVGYAASAVSRLAPSEQGGSVVQNDVYHERI